MKNLAMLFIVLLMIGTFSAQVGLSKTQELSNIVFYVAWYDVGKSALEGLKGVVKVTNGFKMFREVNRVTFDSSKITPADMISVLKRAGTFGGVASGQMEKN